MMKVKGEVKEKGPGIGKIVETLGGLGHLTLGIQGEKALEKHPNTELTVGEVAAIHELGLAPGVPKRSWLAAWVDANQARMVQEAKAALQDVLAGKMSRKRAFEKLGYQWAKEMRENIASGGVTPPLRATTVKATGRGTPLFDTHTLHNAVTYKVFLPRWKNVPASMTIANAKTLPPDSAAVQGSPQPTDKARRLKEAKLIARQQKKWEKGYARHLIRYQKRLALRKQKLGLAATVKMKVPKARKAKAARVLSSGGARRVPRARAQQVLLGARTQRKASWALKWLKKIAKQFIKGKSTGVARNQGYGSSRHGYARRR